MVDFNPIRDLRSPEADPFNVPAGQSTQEVEDIRLRLVLTREKTENVVKIIKNKGLTFKKDIEKIQELQRRLRTTIPRIPILRGDASTQIGSQVGLQRRGMSGLDFSRFFRSTKTATKTSFPLLDVIITAIVFSLSRGKNKNKVTVDPKAINKIKEFIRVKPKVKPQIGETVTPFRDPSKVVPFKRPVKTGKGTVIEGDASQRTVDVDFEVVSDQNILERVTSLLKARRLRKYSKEKGFLSFSKDADKIPRIPSLTRVQEQLLRMSKSFTKNFPKGFKPQLSRSGINAREQARLTKELKQLEKNIPEYEIFDFLKKVKLESPTSLKIDLNKSFQKEYQKIMKLYKQEKMSVLDMFEQTDALRKTYELEAIRIDRYGSEVKQIFEGFKNIKLNSPQADSLFKGLFKDIQKIPKKFPKLKDKIFTNKEGGTPLSNINIKPMSNDIAMLNTDTGYRDIYVIQVDSNSIG